MGLVSDATMKALSPNSRMGKIMQSQVLKMSVDKFNEVIYQCACICQGRKKEQPKTELSGIIQKALDVMTAEQADEMIYQITLLKKSKQELERRKEKKENEQRTS